jgi:hypothetical protein
MIQNYGVAKVRKATVRDAKALAPKLRKEDLAEIAASCSETPEEVLVHGVKTSDKCYAIETKNGVVAIFGTTPLDAFNGSVWLLGSEELFTLKYPFLRNSKKWLNHLYGDKEILGNLVYEKNTKHVVWLRWLGFRFLRRLSIKGEPFIEFVRLKD